MVDLLRRNQKINTKTNKNQKIFKPPYGFNFWRSCDEQKDKTKLKMYKYKFTMAPF